MLHLSNVLTYLRSAIKCVSQFQVNFRERPITISKPIQVKEFQSTVHTHSTENLETEAHILCKLVSAEASEHDQPALGRPRLTGVAALRRAVIN